MLEFWVSGFGSSLNANILRVVFHSPVHPTYFYVDLCTRGKEKLQEICHNFELDLAPRHGACQGTSTLEGPYARDTWIDQRIKILRVWFWLGRATGYWGGRGWKYRCIIYLMHTPLMLSYFTHRVTFMWWRRVLTSFVLIIQKCRIARGMSCNRFMTQRQRTELPGATNKGTLLLCHQDKLRIWRKRIWPFFVALESKLTTKIIPHHRTSLNRYINSNRMDKNVARCGNQRALYALARQTIFRIISHFLGTTQNSRCWIWAR